MTESSKTTEQSQSSQTRPWAEAMPLVSSLFSKYGNLDTGVTPNQGGALTNLANSVSNLPNFGSQGAGAIGKLFSSDSSPQVGMLQSAYGDMKTNLGGTASGAHLNPYETPGFSDAIRTMIQDTTDKTKGVYAGSGRDPSGAGSFAQSLGRGITSGVAPTIASQYGQNYQNMVSANNSLFQGAGNTASGINNLRQSDQASWMQGLSGAGAIPGLYSSPAQAQYAVANQQYSQPFQNLAQLLQPSVALASLGQNSSGQGTSTQTNHPSWMSNIGQGIGVGSSLMAMFSDERLKTDIAPVGKLNDGQNVYSYCYKGDATPRIGLMAQEVLEHAPEAVGRHSSGALIVDYGKATRRARVGALREAA
jgi:hypothetical protein